MPVAAVTIKTVSRHFQMSLGTGEAKCPLVEDHRFRGTQKLHRRSSEVHRRSPTPLRGVGMFFWERVALWTGMAAQRLVTVGERWKEEVVLHVLHGSRWQRPRGPSPFHLHLTFRVLSPPIVRPEDLDASRGGSQGRRNLPLGWLWEPHSPQTLWGLRAVRVPTGESGGRGGGIREAWPC